MKLFLAFILGLVFWPTLEALEQSEKDGHEETTETKTNEFVEDVTVDTGDFYEEALEQSEKDGYKATVQPLVDKTFVEAHGPQMYGITNAVKTIMRPVMAKFQHPTLENPICMKLLPVIKVVGKYHTQYPNTPDGYFNIQ